MEKEHPSTTIIERHSDSSDTSIYPPYFLQKGFNYIQKTGKPIKMWHTEDKIYLRKTNGQIIAWSYYTIVNILEHNEQSK